MSLIGSAEELRRRYAPPGVRAVRKQLAHLDHHARAFIACSPFLVLGTSAPNGTGDVSPRGGAPGFVAVLDDTHLAVPDYAGNNRLDSMANLLTNPAVGLLFFVPGKEETLRVNGTGTISEAPDVLAAFDGPVTPRVAVVVQVEEAYLHCAKSVRRAGLWRPESWPSAEHLASYACAVREQAVLDMPAEDIQAELDADYSERLWMPGGSRERETPGSRPHSQE